MHSLSVALAWLSIAAQLAIIVNLLRHKLVVRYRPFLAMLTIGVVRDSFLLFLDPNTTTYCEVWAFTLVLWLVAQLATALSGYFTLASCYQGIGSFAGWLFLSSIAVGWLICLLVYRHVSAEAYFDYVMVAQSAETSSSLVLTCSAVLVAAFLTRFPSPFRKMPRNLICHLALLACFFGTTFVFEIAMTKGDGSGIGSDTWIRNVESVYFICINLCYTLWTILFSREGETALRWPGMEPNTREAIRDLNATLVRRARGKSLHRTSGWSFRASASAAISATEKNHRPS